MSKMTSGETPLWRHSPVLWMKLVDFVNFSMNSKMENIQDLDINLQGVHLVLYIFILAFIIENVVTFSRHPLLLLASQDKVNNEVHYYDTFELIGIRSFMNKNPGTFILPPGTVFRVRSLKIQRKMRKKHHGGIGRVQLIGSDVNTINLIAVVTTSFHDNAQGFENRNSTWIKCTIANVRSLKSKKFAA